MTSYQVGVSAEAFVAALLARAGFHVSVQYGANQPGYDLVAERRGRAYLVSVKGSQDGSWGLTQSLLRNADYHQAIRDWVARHREGLIFALVQFRGRSLTDLPDIYLATCGDIAAQLRSSGGGLGDTVLHVEKSWRTGRRAGHTDRIPADWKFSAKRIGEIFA